MKKILYVLLLFPILAIGQTTTENYTKVTTYRQETSVTIQNPADTVAKVDITYYDGLGRPIQKIANKQSATGNNIVTHIEYDQMGRIEKEFLPYGTTNGSLDFDSNGYDNTMGYPEYQGQNPYSQKFFEASPLSRVLKQAAPGLPWEGHATDDDDHTIKFVNQTNDSLEVKHFKATTQWNNALKLYLPTFVNDGSYYNKNELHKTITKDENWIPTDGNNNTTEEFKDKEGKVILKKTYNDGEAHETYYVYDIYGNLTFVIPPKVDVNDPITDDILNKLCYQYKYDERNRLVEKKLPEKQWEFIVYDNLDRVVATGPAFNPFGGNQIGWLISKYDVFNRVVYTAWKEESQITNAERKQFQNDLNNSTIINENKTGSNVDSFANLYSSQVIPLTGYKLLTISYYDDYSFPSAPSPTGTVLGQDIEPNVKGLQTGSWVRVLTSPSEILATTNYTFYDNKYRVIESHSNNYLQGYTKVKTEYNFEGQVLLTETDHQGTLSNPKIKVQEEFEYTPQGRLLNHYHKINNQPKELITHNEYNELGQLINKNVGGEDVVNNSGLQKVNYSYNIRGWLTSINDIDALNVVGAPTDLFAFKINYDQVEDDLNDTVKNLYNGNISETFWKSSSDNIKRKYGYSYDNLNRLLKAQYQKPDSNTSLTKSYNESLSYDKNGNITALFRNGELDEDSQTLEIDNLDYIYENNSNRLSIVHDNSLDPNGFKDDSDVDPFDQDADYDYDDNGNMKKDDNKGITSIAYNHLNLPTEINFGATGRITYLYDATGKKLIKKVHVNNNTADVVTRYLDGFQYKNDIIQFFPTAEGYANRLNSVYDSGNYFQVPKGEPDLFSYVYNYTDHLGNIRLSYTKEKGTNVLKIVEENHYYPFGLKHNNYNSSKMLYAKEGLLEKQKPLPPYMAMSYNYKFQNKEWQDELGLNEYDFGARGYMPDIVRTTTLDPLAEKFYSFSPYSFLNNNPLSFIDPTGMSADGWIKQVADGVTTMTYNSGVNTTAEAKEAGYKNVEAVYQSATVSATDGSYTYHLQADGNVTNTEGNRLTATSGVSFNTEGGTKISSWGLMKPYEPGRMASGACTPMEFSSPFFSWGWAAKGIGHAWNSVFGAAASTTAEASGSVYSVAYQTKLSSELFPGGSYYAHFKAANTSLSNAMASDAAFSSSMSSLGVSIPRSATGNILGKSPTNWVWHHSVETGVMQLVPKTQHTSGSLFWNTMHPNGLGGMATWNK